MPNMAFDWLAAVQPANLKAGLNIQHGFNLEIS